MRELIPIINAMNVAQAKAISSVDGHISKAIDGLLEDLEEEGFPYQDALDIAIEHVLFQKCSLQGRIKAKHQIDTMLKAMMINDELAA